MTRRPDSGLDQPCRACDPASELSSPGAGIGRQGRLKPACPQGRGGSTPPPGTGIHSQPLKSEVVAPTRRPRRSAAQKHWVGRSLDAPHGASRLARPAIPRKGHSITRLDLPERRAPFPTRIPVQTRKRPSEVTSLCAISPRRCATSRVWSAVDANSFADAARLAAAIAT